jgi:hypothetical protein
MLVCLGLVILLMSCNCWEQPWFPQFFPETDAGESRYPREGHPQCVRADLPCAPRFVDPLFWCRPQLKLWLGLSHFCMSSGKISSSRGAPTKGHDWQTISGIGDVIISIHEVGINLVLGAETTGWNYQWYHTFSDMQPFDLCAVCVALQFLFCVFPCYVCCQCFT